MIVMGLDASTTSTGWSIFNDDELVSYGCIKPKGDNWREKIKEEFTSLQKIIDQYNPVKIYAEDVPLKDGKPTLVKLGAVHGMMLCLATIYCIDIKFLLPSGWREPLNLFDGTREGTHREVLKKKAIEMANKEFGLDLLWYAPKSKRNQDDAAEAILVAYSQIKKQRFGKPKSQQ